MHANFRRQWVTAAWQNIVSTNMDGDSTNASMKIVLILHIQRNGSYLCLHFLCFRMLHLISSFNNFWPFWKANLRKHSKMHTIYRKQLNPFRCPIAKCDASFNRDGELQIHLNIHNNLVHYCYYCPFRSASTQSLKAWIDDREIGLFM